MSFFFRYKWHFLVWAVYFVFWTALSVNGYHTPFFLALTITLGWAIGQGTLAYFCIYRLLPLYFYPRRYGSFALILLVAIGVSALFLLGYQQLVFGLAHYPMPYSTGAAFAYFVMGDLYSTFIVIAIKSIRDRVSSDRRTQLLEKEKTGNELRFLKSQMNPHFLFNAINSIYVLIKKDPDLASHTLVKFADMLRYQLYECNADRIPIEKEIVYLDNYISLEKLRRGAGLCTEYTVGEEVRHFSIAPLLIIPFVENAFKYVSSHPDRPNKVTVSLRCRDEFFELSVENTLDEDGGAPPSGAPAGGAPAVSTPAGDSPGNRVSAGGPGSGGSSGAGGIGLGNVRRRLELIYNGSHQLEIHRTAKTYSVFLKIPTQ
jgi:sensor histidine kinase YesM